MFFMNRGKVSLKAQDIIVLGKIICTEGAIKQKDLATSLGLSEGEVSFSLARLRNAKLIHENKLESYKLAAIEFFEHAVKYFFPLEFEGVTSGILIGPSADFVKSEVLSSRELETVWPYSEGENWGLSVKPLHKNLPQAVRNDFRFFKLMNVVEIFRGLGGARYREKARTWLHQMIIANEY